MAMPVFIVALAIAGTVGASGAHLILSLSVVSWAEYARLARALTLQEKNKNYMTALKAGGCGHARIIFRHVLRNILPSVIALTTMESVRSFCQLPVFPLSALVCRHRHRNGGSCLVTVKVISRLIQD